MAMPWEIEHPTAPGTIAVRRHRNGSCQAVETDDLAIDAHIRALTGELVGTKAQLAAETDKLVRLQPDHDALAAELARIKGAIG